MSLLQRIKSGKNNYKIVEFPGSDEKVAIVTLSSNQITLAKTRSEDYIVKNKITDEHYKDIVLQQFLAYEFLRDKDDIDKKIADNIEETRSLDVNELSYFVLQYNLFTQETSPFLNAVSEEQLESLKKTLAEMTLNDLNGESLIALRNFLMSLV